jgi:hypothetical protein
MDLRPRDLANYEIVICVDGWQRWSPLLQRPHIQRWRAPKSLVEPTWGFNYVELRKGLGGHSWLPALKGVEGRARSPGIRLGRDQAIWSQTCIQNQHKLVRTHSACIWCWDKPRANSDSHDTPRPGPGRCHHHPPYSILCATPPHLHLNGTFSRDFQSGVPKLSRFGLLGLWDIIASRPNLWSGRGLNQTFSPIRELSNAVLHSHTAHRERVDSRLLVVGSQIANLTPGPSFAHNLGFRCPNDQCEAISDIYTSRPFQWHQEHPKGKVFCPLLSNSKHLEVPEDSKSPTLGVWISSSHLAKV